MDEVRSEQGNGPDKALTYIGAFIAAGYFLIILSKVRNSVSSDADAVMLYNASQGIWVAAFFTLILAVIYASFILHRSVKSGKKESA